MRVSFDTRKDKVKSQGAASIVSQLSVSIVSYAPDVDRLRDTLGSLRAAAEVAAKKGLLKHVVLKIIDNGPGVQYRELLEALVASEWGRLAVGSWEILHSGQNLGFGAGHNLALEGMETEYHLVLNPDVILSEDALAQSIVFMNENSEVGLLTPLAVDGLGNRQYLCKRYPTVLDLVVRGFAPRVLRHLFHRRQVQYEMRELIGDRVVLDVPFVSGCFMFFRSKVLSAAGGFSKRYFLYFEDFDLSKRAAKVARIAFVPSVRIKHFGGDAAGKGFKHIAMFLKSAYVFFSSYGWRWW